jgi:hypothetical protein
MALAADHNAGTVPLTFGITSNDEMCFTIGAFYLDDDTAPMPPVPDCYAGGHRAHLSLVLSRSRAAETAARNVLARSGAAR